MPVVSKITDSFEAYLIVNKDGISFFAPSIAKIPYRIEFESGKLAHRSTQIAHQKEKLLRACIIKNLKRPVKILDATAGFGRDAFILASSGAKVTLVERHPVVAALLEDGINRICHSAIKSRLNIIKDEAQKAFCDFLQAKKQPDIIYLDPMFHEARQAKVKKDLQILQMILEEEPQDQNELLPLALKVAKHRVVVKRAIFAAPLNKMKPSFSFTGKHSRFDVYVS